MSALWSMWVYDRRGDLWERFEGSEENLLEQGVCITTLRGQIAWRCSLRKNGKPVAECKHGVWKEAKP